MLLAAAASDPTALVIAALGAIGVFITTIGGITVAVIQRRSAKARNKNIDNVTDDLLEEWAEAKKRGDDLRERVEAQATHIQDQDVHQKRQDVEIARLSKKEDACQRRLAYLEGLMEAKKSPEAKPFQTRGIDGTDPRG